MIFSPPRFEILEFAHPTEHGEVVVLDLRPFRHKRFQIGQRPESGQVHGEKPLRLDVRHFREPRQLMESPPEIAVRAVDAGREFELGVFEFAVDQSEADAQPVHGGVSPCPGGIASRPNER